MSDRRYSDEDARRILALAAEAEAVAPAEARAGWSLEELQRAGAEAGIAPTAIAAAADALERAAPPERRYLGLPVAVSRAVSLPRTMTDEDWDRLVAQLRDTFEAEGRVRVSGARREWRVGNLRVTHEPRGNGALLDFRTRKGDARFFLRAGTALLVTSAAGGAAATMGVQGFDGISTAVLVGAAGVVTLLVGAARLPVWASARARQFASLADYARRLVGP